MRMLNGTKAPWAQPNDSLDSGKGNSSHNPLIPITYQFHLRGGTGSFFKRPFLPMKLTATSTGL